MSTTPELYLPTEQASLMTPRDYRIAMEWAAPETTLESVMDFMGTPSYLDLADGTQQGYVDRNLHLQEDDKEAVALMLPFANGYGPSMDIRASVMQDVLQNRRVLVFPNNTKDQEWYAATENTAESLAQNAVAVVDSLGIEKLHVVGYSQGATIGALMLKHMPDRFDVSDSGVMLGEAPNVVKGREAKALSRAFTKGGTKPLNKAINDSGIPALSEAQHARGGIDSVRQLAMFAAFGLGTNKAVNKQLRESMTGDSFVSNILEADQLPARLKIVRMAGSLICTDELDGAISASPINNSSLTVVNGYGHEGGDNVILHGLLARQAVEG